MSLRPISRREAWAALLRHNPPDWVCRHCRAVEGLAAAMCDRAEAQGLRVDRALVQAGALLHDVGRSITQDVRHASLGAELVRKDGFPESLALVVERHTGAGIDETEALRLGLPVKDYTPRTLEERIVAHADNLYSGDKRMGLSQLQAKYLAQGLGSAWEKIRRLHDELRGLLGTDLERLPAAELSDPASAP